MPKAITRPPSHSQTTSGFTATPRVTRPDVGLETSVRYTSRRMPVCTDGVPMPPSLFGNDEIAGVYTPSVRLPSWMRTRAEIVVFCALASTVRPR